MSCQKQWPHSGPRPIIVCYHRCPRWCDVKESVLEKERKKPAWPFLCFTVSTLQHQRHRSSVSWPCLQLKRALRSYWLMSLNFSFCLPVERRQLSSTVIHKTERRFKARDGGYMTQISPFLPKRKFGLYQLDQVTHQPFCIEEEEITLIYMNLLNPERTFKFPSTQF